MGKRKGTRKVLRLFIFHAVLLLSASYAQATTKMYFVHTDHLGTPQVLTDSNQEVVWEGRQSPFGEMNNDQGAVSQPLRFPGQYADAETGFSYNYFRDYDPSLGRYIQSDPIGLDGGVNTYGYALQKPVMNIDPYGLEVYVCGRPADLPFPLNIPNHEWILTDTMEAGMGAQAGEIPGQEGSDYPGAPVEVVDHTGEVYAENSSCDFVPDVDEDCVNKKLELGRSLGRWGPTNQCQSFVNEVINSCRKK